MITNCHSKDRRRGSIIVMFSLMLPVIMMLMGLAIDRTMLFIVEAKLGAAVDGAALGAGRLLGTNANTQEIAGEFLNANFPTGYWNSRNLQNNITATDVLATHTITVNASVDVPLLFMRMFTQGLNTVYASAVATRRDSRVELVLDRSGSMTGSPMTAMLAGAQEFVAMFTAGTDELGLIVFSGTAVVAYPTTRPYSYSTTLGGGPDTSFDNTGNIPTLITNTACGGDTNTSEALELAFIEIQKAHNRDVAANGSDDRFNAIVLFTDGMPTAMSVYLNAPASPPGDVISNSSGCTYKTATAATSTTQMVGWAGIFGSNPQALYAVAGASTDNTTTLNWVKKTSDNAAINPTTPLGGCGHLSGTDLADLTKIPSYTSNGTPTTDSGYIYGAAYNGSTSYDATQKTSGYHWGIAVWNATDEAGVTIRTGITGMNATVIYTIGYTGDGGVDAALLKRLANTQDSTSYDSTKPSGTYTSASSTTDLTAAFSTVASELLRLAR